MKSLILCATAAVLSASTTVFAQHGDDEIADLKELEARLTRALLERDTELLDRLWHDDLIFIARNGRQSTKGERLAAQRGSTAQPGETNTNDEVSVRMEGETAIVTVVSTWTMPAAAVSTGRYRALHVWTRSAGAWQLLAAQVASIDE
jgi:ketosteroid isomerase-like protein